MSLDVGYSNEYAMTDMRADENITIRAMRLDGEEIHHYSFRLCTLEIAGTVESVHDDCTFLDCQWVLVEEAATMSQS